VGGHCCLGNLDGEIADRGSVGQRLHTYFQQRKRDAVKLEEGTDEEPSAAEFDGGYKVPGEVFSRLFDYQKTGQYSPLSFPAYGNGL
jgi:hypothetical protein